MSPRIWNSPVSGAMRHCTPSMGTPTVPTATEQGVPGVEVNAWYGVFAPAGTPAAAITRINQEINDALKLPDVREKLTAAGIEVVGGTPQVLADYMKSDNLRYGSLAKELNIKAD